MRKSKSFAFTLAEVLITLGIIGVVAAITIPTLMNNVQDNEFHTAAKKAFSVLSQATEKMVYENSGTIWDVSSSDAATLSKSMADEYAKYLSVVKEDFIENIQTQDWYFYKSPSLYSGFVSSGGTRYALLLKDGMTMRFQGWQSCSRQYGKAAMPYACAMITVDVNGNKPPNMLGRDAYAFYVGTNGSGVYKVLPSGKDVDDRDCSAGSTSTDTSFGCTEYVINNQPLPP